MKTTNSVFVGHMNKQASGNAKERSMTGGWNRCSSLLCSFFVFIGTIGNRKNFISLSIISAPKIVTLYHTLIQLLHCILVLVLSLLAGCNYEVHSYGPSRKLGLALPGIAHWSAPQGAPIHLPVLQCQIDRFHYHGSGTSGADQMGPKSQRRARLGQVVGISHVYTSS
ncbi:hypothetical protein V8E53_012259 [Lactarius tabidus]